MRRLVLLVASIVVVLGAVAGLNARVDPWGSLYKPGALTAALASSPPCLVSQELVGGRYLSFKEDVFRRRGATTLVVGSSRVLKIRSHGGEAGFANLGFPGTSPETLAPLFRTVAASGRPETAYVGVEFFWFNPRFSAFDEQPGWRSKAAYLLGRSTLRSSYEVLRSAPYVLADRWRRTQNGSRCVIGRASPSIAWDVDGSRVYSFELQPDGWRPPRQVFSSDLETLRSGYYAGWTVFDRERVRALDEALAIAQRAGWRVVGFAPPDPTRYVNLFATGRETARWWRTWHRAMPQLFRKHGFAWLDLSDVRSVPCAQDAFVDAGFHTTAACSDRMRADLDRAAARLPPPR
jgi:hypothetical protein